MNRGRLGIRPAIASLAISPMRLDRLVWPNSLTSHTSTTTPCASIPAHAEPWAPWPTGPRSPTSDLPSIALPQHSRTHARHEFFWYRLEL